MKINDKMYPLCRSKKRRAARPKTNPAVAIRWTLALALIALGLILLLGAAGFAVCLPQQHMPKWLGYLRRQRRRRCLQLHIWRTRY